MMRIGGFKMFECDVDFSNPENPSMKLYKLEDEGRILIAWLSENIVYYYHKELLIKSGWWKNKKWKSARF